MLLFNPGPIPQLKGNSVSRVDTINSESLHEVGVGDYEDMIFSANERDQGVRWTCLKLNHTLKLLKHVIFSVTLNHCQ